MTFLHPSKENENPSSNNKEDVNVERIKHIVKHAIPKLVRSFIEQSKNISAILEEDGGQNHLLVHACIFTTVARIAKEY